MSQTQTVQPQPVVAPPQVSTPNPLIDPTAKPFPEPFPANRTAPFDTAKPISYEPRPTDRKVSELEARERAVAIREKALDETVPDVSKIDQANIDQQVVGTFSLCAFDAFRDQPNIDPNAERALKCTTIAVLVLRNGFVVVGESVVAAPENYDAGAGRNAAIDDAKRQLWPLENYLLKSRMSGMLVAPDYELRRQEYRDSVALAEATSSAPAWEPRPVAAVSSPTSRLP